MAQAGRESLFTLTCLRYLELSALPECSVIPNAREERAFSAAVPGTRGFRVLGWSSARE